MTSLSTLTIIERTARTLDVPLPDTLVSRVDAAKALAAQFTDVGVAQLHSAVLDAVEQGRNYRSDKQVAALLLDRQLSGLGIAQAAEQRRDSLIQQCLREHCDELLTTWADTLQPSLDRLTAAAVELRHVEDLDASYAQVTAKGGTALHAWADAVGAMKLITAAATAAALLAMNVGVTLTVRQKLLVATPADLDSFDELARSTSAPNIWAVARAGLPLRLVASIDELRERITDLDAQRQAVLDRAAERPKRPAFQGF